eukprot:SAG31_NODE_23593_length_501_cov_0.636816_2_plen_83_part_01
MRICPVHFNWFLGVDGYRVGHPPLGPSNYSQSQYLEIAKGQLQEVIELFGDEGPLEVKLRKLTSIAQTSSYMVAERLLFCMD